MNCEICGLVLFRVESSLMCKNGHTIQNTVEVCDDLLPATTSRSRKITKLKTLRKRIERNKSTLAFHIIYFCLFQEAKQHFKFSDNWFYKQLMSFYSVAPKRQHSSLLTAGLSQIPETPTSQPFFASQGNTRSKEDYLDSFEILGTKKINPFIFCSIIYLSKRVDEESNDRILLFDDFCMLLDSFGITKRVISIMLRQNVTLKSSGAIRSPDPNFTPIILREVLSRLADIDSYYSFPGKLSFHDTGVIPQHILDIKQNIRSKVRRDIRIWLKYFDVILEKLKVEKTDDLLFYFKKLIFSLHPKRVYVPEETICLYLATYFINQNKFEGSDLEVQIMNLLRCSKRRLKISQSCFAIYTLDITVSPNIFVASRESICKGVVKSLRYATTLIEIIKESRKRLMLEKKENK